jgi:ribokinase
MSVIVIGSINTDLVIRSACLPRPGETVIGGDFQQAHGGKGANQAVAAARAGRSKVTFIGAVGNDDFGRQSFAALRQENLDTRLVKTVDGQASGMALILVDQAGQNMISVAPGANLHLSAADVEAAPDSVFRRAKVLLASLEVSFDAVEAALRRAKEAGLTTILNPAPACTMERCAHLIKLADILTPNEQEAETLSGLSVHNSNSAIGAARWLEKAGPQAVIVTLGRQGAVAVRRSDVDLIQPIEINAVDATAAGDAFNGALAVGLAEGKSLFQAANWASIAGGLAATKAGAQPSLPTRDEIEARANA